MPAVFSKPASPGQTLDVCEAGASDRVAIKTSCKKAKTFYVSACDAERVKAYDWTMWGKYPNFPRLGSVHQFIMGERPDGVPPEYVIDHVNRDRLDNTRGNLRWVSARFNSWNKATKGSSRFNGVSWCAKAQKWRASPLSQHMGFYKEERDAALVSAKALIREFGEWAATSDLIVGPDLLSQEEVDKLCAEIDAEGDLVEVPKRSLPTGVYWHSAAKKYAARYKTKHLGLFTSVDDAKACYDAVVQAERDAEWNEHVARGIPRDQDGHAIIALSSEGYFAKVPERFYFQLTFRRTWCLCAQLKYALGRWEGKTKQLHQVVWKLLHPNYTPSKKLSIDHIIPEQTLNNLEENLRLATRSQQMRNQAKRPGTSSKYKCVTFHKATGKWQAQVRDADGKQQREYYATEVEAAHAVNQMRIRFFGANTDLIAIDEA